MDNQETALAVTTAYIAPAIDVKGALGRYQAMKEFIDGVLKKDHDFGTIPGSEKPALLKPGAEKLSSFFGLNPLFPEIESVEDWMGVNHGGEPFFSYRYRCQLIKNGSVAGEGIGSCNSWESKYRYRSAAKVCPKCGKETIIKGKTEYGGGWICYAKKGGCGAKFVDGDQSIESQPSGKVKNPDIFDLVNTVDKMAQKRSFIAAVLITTNASDYFTQDLDDFIKQDDFVDGEFSTPTPKPIPQQKPTPQPTSERPYSPEALKERIGVMVDSFAGKTCTDGQRTSVKINLSAMTGSEDNYHTLLAWLVGEPHVSKLSNEQVLALAKWIHVTKDADDQWIPDALSILEAKSAYEQALKAQGQQELPIQ